MYQKWGKQSLDRVLSAVGLIILAPILLVISIWIKSTSEGPVLFRQKRIGKDKKTFEILKFRTMYSEAPRDCPTHLLKQAENYITPIGTWLRKTSLDELPQLINILKGDMSIVGPRPALWNQYDLIEEREKYKANAIQPGLTGWAQINGRDELEIKEKAKLDGEYVKKSSFWFDLEIFCKTLRSVIKKEGVKEGKKERQEAKV